MIRGMRYLSMVLLVLVFTGSLGSCGKAANETGIQLDSNTNWLKSCESDDTCSGSLRCYCGQCTQPCGENRECALLAGAACADSSGAVCGDAPSAGGLCVLGCTGDGDCGVDFTCTDNQCVARPCTRGYQSYDDVFALVAGDLASLDADDALFSRYFSLANRWSYAACDGSLNAERQGLSKLLNSLSSDPTVTPPVPIDAAQTLYRIDLQDYGWDRPLVVGGVPHADGWEALVANNPYAVPFVGADADSATSDSGTAVPVMFANSFIATAARPEVYYALAGIPERLEDLLGQLGFEAAALPLPDFQAGFIGDQGLEFVAQHWQMQLRAGYLWQISAFGREAGTLFQNPFGDPLGEREIVFTLPNGLHAFAFMSADGGRLDASTLVDVMEPDLVGRPPLANLRRHAGAVTVSDEVHDFVLENPGNFAGSSAQTILQRYPGPEALAQLLESDYGLFTLPALTAANVAVGAPEPITQTFAAFARAVSLEDAAGDLMLESDFLLSNIRLLNPALGVLDGGTVPREAFTGLYRESLCILSVTLENQLDPSACP